MKNTSVKALNLFVTGLNLGGFDKILFLVYICAFGLVDICTKKYYENFHQLQITIWQHYLLNYTDS